MQILIILPEMYIFISLILGHMLHFGKKHTQVQRMSGVSMSLFIAASMKPYKKSLIRFIPCNYLYTNSIVLLCEFYHSTINGALTSDYSTCILIHERAWRGEWISSKGNLR